MNATEEANRACTRLGHGRVVLGNGGDVWNGANPIANSRTDGGTAGPVKAKAMIDRMIDHVM